MFLKIEFEMRAWVDQSWEELQKTVLDFAEQNFPQSLMFNQGFHYYDQSNGVTEFFKTSEFYVFKDLNDLTNVLKIEKKADQDVLCGCLFADVGRDGVLDRFSARLDDQRIA